MKPDDYNARELAAGRITASHITALTRFYQDCHGLTVDGMLGPVTRDSMHDLYNVPNPPIIQRVGVEAAIAWARREHATWSMSTAYDDAADHQDMIREYFADEPRRTNWCAAFVADALEAAGVPVPRKGPPRRGAQALTRWVAEHGRWILEPSMAHRRKAADGQTFGHFLDPGDVICWRRPPLCWRGHVALILRIFAEDYIVNVNGNPTVLAIAGSIEIAEGNVNGGQLVIRTLKADEWPTRLSGLYGVARPAWGSK